MQDAVEEELGRSDGFDLGCHREPAVAGMGDDDLVQVQVVDGVADGRGQPRGVGPLDLDSGPAAIVLEEEVDLRTTMRATNAANGELYCGVHNRLEERGFRPVRLPGGKWTILRPDGRPITASV